MLSTKIKDGIYVGSNGRKSLYDLEVPSNFNGKLIVFIHGYMGYKDWGCWELVQNFFVPNGYGFCKYNVSHNGGTIEQPIDFPDLEAFAENNYSKEYFDLQCMLETIEEHFETYPDIFLIGHSRGGGIALLASRDERVKKIATWAAIADIAKRFPTGKELEVWKTQGTRYGMNSRTNQKMPNRFSQYEDFIAHQDELNIEKACLESSVPTLVIHGDQDTSVDIEEGRQIALWLKTHLFEIEEANHTFGAAQPWVSDEMPEHLKKVCDLTLGFFQI
jgi:pimeloyl-ACP methyl ester carboxylesterase